MSEGEKIMAPTAAMVYDLLDTLEVEDYNSVIDYIRFLSDSRKKAKIQRSLNALAEIQNMFSDDKGWNSEEEMLADMAKFRKERMKI